MLDMAVGAAKWREGLFLSAQEVLETMFFTPVHGEAERGEEPREENCGGFARLGVSLDFDGDLRGRFAVSVEPACADGIAANFLGADDPFGLADGQTGQVLCELANMICGAVLSRVQPGGRFDLTHPEVVNPPKPLGQDQISVAIGLEDGQVRMRLTLRKHRAKRTRRERVSEPKADARRVLCALE